MHIVWDIVASGVRGSIRSGLRHRSGVSAVPPLWQRRLHCAPRCCEAGISANALRARAPRASAAGLPQWHRRSRSTRPTGGGTRIGLRRATTLWAAPPLWSSRICFDVQGRRLTTAVVVLISMSVPFSGTRRDETSAGVCSGLAHMLETSSSRREIGHPA